MNKPLVHIAALFAMIFWGNSFIGSKIVFEQYTPLSTIFFRLIVSVVALFLFMLITNSFEKIEKKDWWLLIGSSFFNPFLYFIGENYGLSRVSASVTAFIIATIPLFTPVVAYKIFGEKLSYINIIGLMMAFAGIVLIIVGPDMSLVASPEGVALLFLAVFSAVIYTVFLKKLAFTYKPVSIIAWQNLMGILFFLPLFLYFDLGSVISVIPSGKTIIVLISLGVFASSAAFVLFTFVIKHIGISRGNIYTNLVPVFAGISAYLILGEQFGLLNMVGMLIIVTGVFLSEYVKLKKENQK